MINKWISKRNDIIWVEPSCLATIFFCNTYYDEQYYLKNTGQNGGTTGIDINVEPAWDIITGSSGITVAVVDDGVVHSHEDMVDVVLPGKTANYRCYD